MLTVLALAFVLVVAGWAAWVEWRFHRDLGAAFATRVISLGLDRDGPFPDLAARLDGLAAEVANAQETRAKAPVSLFAGLLGFDAADKAASAYRLALDRHLPPVMAAAIDRALASEGEPGLAYDTLRAWSVLYAQADWQPAWLAGWASDRAASDLAWPGWRRTFCGWTSPRCCPLPRMPSCWRRPGSLPPRRRSRTGPIWSCAGLPPWPT